MSSVPPPETPLSGCATLSDLCPADKSRVARLVQQLVSISDEHEKAVHSWDNERKETGHRLQKLKRKNDTIVKESDSIQFKFQQTLKLIPQYQDRILALHSSLDLVASELADANKRAEIAERREREALDALSKVQSETVPLADMRPKLAPKLVSTAQHVAQQPKSWESTEGTLSDPEMPHLPSTPVVGDQGSVGLRADSEKSGGLRITDLKAEGTEVEVPQIDETRAQSETAVAGIAPFSRESEFESTYGDQVMVKFLQFDYSVLAWLNQFVLSVAAFSGRSPLCRVALRFASLL
jgi:hypothetical protein